MKSSIIKSRRIVCAAMKMKDGSIVSGIRHFSPDMRLTLKRIYGDGYKHGADEPGFIDTLGNFLNGKDAWIAAEQNSQVLYQVSTPGTLYSENLY